MDDRECKFSKLSMSVSGGMTTGRKSGTHLDDDSSHRFNTGIELSTIDFQETRTFVHPAIRLVFIGLTLPLVIQLLVGTHYDVLQVDPISKLPEFMLSFAEYLSHLGLGNVEDLDGATAHEVQNVIEATSAVWGTGKLGDKLFKLVDHGVAG
jgi:hypothetical protein